MNGKAFFALALVVLIPITVLAQAKEFDLQKADTSDRMTYHRAIDAAVWAMPLMNYKFYRDALIDAGVGPNDIGYYSKVQDWKFQTATPNNTTPYVLAHWTIKDGPIVVEIPAATADVGIFGTLMDAWKRPIDDVERQGETREWEQNICCCPRDTLAQPFPMQGFIDSGQTTALLFCAQS